MKKPIKILVIALAAILGLLVILTVAVSLLIDPNAYKNEVVAAVKQHTGRDLKIDGDIKLSVFPWVGMEMAKVELGNASGFGDKPFVSIKDVDIKVALLPLLSKNIEVKRLVLNGLHLNLMQNASGKTNWDDLVDSTEPTASTTPRLTEDTGDADANILTAFSVGGISIQNADITWDDKLTKTFLGLHKFNFKTGRIRSGKPVTLALSTELETSALPKRIPITLNSTLNADLKQQSLVVSKLDFGLAGLRLHGTLKGQQILGDAQFQGHIELESFDLANLLKQMGNAVTFTDANALKAVGLKADIATVPNKLTTDNLQLALDGSIIKGKFSISNYTKPKYYVELAIDNIDIDRYLPPATEAAATTESSADQGTSSGDPLAPLRDLHANGKLDIGNLKVAGLKLNDIGVTLNAQAGIINLRDIKAKLYQGQVRGALSIDARRQQPALHILQSLQNVHVGPLLKDMLQYEKFDGIGSVKIDLKTKGLAQQSITNNLNGTLGFNFQDGALHGVDFIKMVREAQQKYNESRGKTVSAEPSTGDTTAYKSLTGTAQVTNGLVKNNDFSLRSKQGDITGKGWADLAKDKMDYRVSVQQNKNGQPAGDKLPIIIRCKVTDPCFKIDFSALAKQEIKKKQDAVIQKQQDKVKKKVEDKLKKLFGR